MSSARESAGGARSAAEELTITLERLYAAPSGNEALLHTLNLHSNFSVMDRAGCIIDVNDNFCQILGYTREELLGQPDSFVYSGAQDDALWTDRWRKIRGGQSWRGEICNRAKNGALLWMDSMIAPVLGEDGHPAIYISIRHDITAAKNSESKLRATEAFLDRTGQTAGVGCWELDVKTRVIRWSAHMTRIYEVDLAYQPELKAVLRFHPPQARAMLRAAMRQCVRSRKGWDLELPLVTGAGRTLWVRSVGEAECVDGRPVRLVGSLQDITARKDIEASLAQERARMVLLLAQLQEANTRFSIASQSAGIAIWELDLSSRTCVWDERMYNLYGMERSTAAVTFEHWQHAVHPEDRVHCLAEVQRALCDKTDFNAEFRIVRPDGELRYLKASARVVLGPDGMAQRMTGVNIDISEPKRAQEQLLRTSSKLRAATLRAEQANQAKSEFLANMSHEIRTPMNAVVGVAHLMAHTALDPEQCALLGNLQNASKSLLAIINDVLDLSKIEAGELMVEHTAFSPRSLLNQVADVMRLHAEDKGIAFRMQLPEELPEVLLGDPTRINQILTNLVSNAIRFTDHGSVEVRVLAAAAAPADGVSVSFIVKDTGIGISAEAQTRLFSPFAQADASITRRYGGTGLGLSIVKSLVKVLGGTVRLDSTPGKGSEFCVDLPFARVAADAAVAPAPVAALAGTMPLRGIRVLVADDSDMNLEVVKCILEWEGAQVSLARNGQEAFDRLQADASQFDVLLLDVQMPVLGGHDAAALIRSELGLVDLPIIALTAGAFSSERDRAIAAGMDDFLTKPFDPAQLVQSILTHVRLGSLHAATPIHALPRADDHPLPWPDIDGIDTADARLRLSNDVRLFLSSLSRLLVDFSEASIVIDGDEAGDLRRQGARMHKLKGAAGMLGAKGICSLASEAEAACLLGDGRRASEIAGSLTGSLQRLRDSAAPAITAARAVAEAVIDPVESEFEPQRVAELVHLLRQQNLSAVDRFRVLEPHLRRHLGSSAHQALRGHMDALQFDAAAEILDSKLAAPVSCASPA